ncbi:MAG: RluA family pseudouridine synthase [Rhodocyclaceae bacterium]|nr:RluA family pseudouridine synthase [Rhodocyclaceae bacterium]
MCGFELVHEDADFLVVNKASGLLSVPGRGPDKQDCLIHRVQAVYPEALAVHRLDMSTSGLLLLARSPAMHRELSKLFEQRQVGKRYIAVVAGELPALAGEINLPLICDWPNRPRQKVDFEIGKPSQTYYCQLAYDPLKNHSRVELTPITGRSHQLRVHLMALGHPILGDDLYGTASSAPRLLLHASQLCFPLPGSGKAQHFESVPEF